MDAKQTYRFEKSTNFRNFLKDERQKATDRKDSGALGEIRRLEDELNDYVKTGEKGEHLKARVNFKKVKDKINFV